MARERNPHREKAKQIWTEYQGNITNRKIAELLGENEKVVAVWKQRDKWNVVQQKKECCTTKKRGAPKGNKNAKDNKGGAAPEKNKNAEKHGFFSKIFPDDPETMEIISSIKIKSLIDILWENIVIQYTAIARAQKVMFVKTKEEMIKELKKIKSERGPNPRFNSDEPGSEPFEETYREEEWEFQFAWDRQATFLQAQSKAMATLQNMISKYEELILKDLATEEQRLRLDKLKAEIKNLEKGNKGNTVEALKSAIEQIKQRRGERVGNE